MVAITTLQIYISALLQENFHKAVVTFFSSFHENCQFLLVLVFVSFVLENCVNISSLSQEGQDYLRRYIGFSVY